MADARVGDGVPIILHDTRIGGRDRDEADGPGKSCGVHAKLPIIGPGDIAGFLAGKGWRPHPAKIDAEWLGPDAHVDQIFLPKLALDALTLDEQTGVIADALKSLLGLGHETNGIVHGGGVLDLRLGRRALWRR